MEERKWYAYDLVFNHFNGHPVKTIRWFLKKNPLLGEVSPIQMIYENRTEKLIKFIETQFEENEKL